LDIQLHAAAKGMENDKYAQAREVLFHHTTMQKAVYPELCNVYHLSSGILGFDFIPHH
jgi:hypothetical protein